MTAKRAYFAEGWFGDKGCGKTFQLIGRAQYEAHRASVRAVLVIDPPTNLRGVQGFEVFRAWGDFLRRVEERGTYPRVAVFQLGLEPEPYRVVMQASIAVGDTVLVVDEVQRFAPAARKVLTPELVQIAEMGRHLPDSTG
jgi:hypothetical protein